MMRRTRALPSNLRLLGQCLLLDFFLTSVIAVGQVPDFTQTLIMAYQGDAAAQHNLGLMYANGEGVAEDDVEAVRWYHLAADQGVADAQFNLGISYDYGEGVPEDDAEAARWYRLAANQGLVEAQSNLGAMYGSGEGVPRNLVTAYAWFNVAAVSGQETAINNRSNVEQQMTPSQIIEAQQLAAEILERIQENQQD